MAISLRVATVADAAVLAEFGARLFEQTFAKDNTPEDMAGYLASAFNPAQQTVELAEPRNLFLIASSDDGTVVGYAMLIRDSRTSTVDADDPAEINRIYIDRALHGTGAGAALMNACIEQARAWEAGVLWLAVWEKNPRAIAFYEKSGFHKVGRKTFQLGSDLQHDFVMVRNLSS